MPIQTSSQQRRTTTRNTNQTTLDGQGTDSSRPGTPATGGPTTTVGKRTPPKLTAKEIIALTNEVNNIESGKKYLECTALAIKGKPYTTSTLTEILLHITQMKGVSLPAITAIRGVAFILEGKATDETAETIARLVIASISPHVAKLQDTEKTISKITEELNTKASMQDTQLTKVQASVDKLATQITDSSTLKPSYATALKMGNHSHQDQELQTQISQQIAREAIKERQLLIDFPINSVLAAGKSSHAQLVERIRKALTNIPKDNDNTEFNIKAIMQFKQGGMVIEFTTKEAADYIRINEETKNLFLKHLDPDATLKE
ncbi:hypothetical protein DFH29DRAFT_1002969 [Suillus ampliporus]|nr:hypothetical protein DFH29DRAFT_1002969 [Suillus ampliporus]